MLNIEKFNIINVLPSTLLKSVEIFLAALFYSICIYFSVRFLPDVANHHLLWPASGLALALIFRFGYAHFFSIMLGGSLAFFANEIIDDPIEVTPLIINDRILIGAFIIVPAIQSYFTVKIVNLFYDYDAKSFRFDCGLIRFFVIAGIIYSALGSIFIITILALLASIDNELFFNVVTHFFWFDFFGVIILLPIILFLTVENNVINSFKKIIILVPVLCIFGVAVVSFDIIHRLHKEQIILKQEKVLKNNAQNIVFRINNIYQQLQALSLLLMADRQDIDKNYSVFAEKIFKVQQEFSNYPPDFSIALLKANYELDVIKNYSIYKMYPENAFSLSQDILLGSDGQYFTPLEETYSQTKNHMLPMVEKVKSPSGSQLIVLSHQIFNDDQKRLLAAVIDMSMLSYETASRYMSEQHLFKIEDELTGYVLYANNQAESSSSENTKNVIHHSISVGNRLWKLLVVYDSAWLESQQGNTLFYTSVLLLTFIALVVLLIFNNLLYAGLLPNVCVRAKADSLNNEQKLAHQKSLDKRNELIALGLDASGLGSWEWQRSDNVIHWSVNIYKILDMTEGSFCGEPEKVFDYIHPQDVTSVRLVDELAKKTLEITDFCCRMITDKGNVIWVTGKYRYFTHEGGRIVRARGVLWDATEETLLQQDNYEKTEALKRSNKELDDFAYIASHDLKEPLRGISNYSTFLMEDYSNILDADGKEMLQSIERLTQNMQQLINDLLDFSRLGRTELAIEKVDINKIVVNVLESLLPRIEELNVYVSLDSPLINICCDRVRIKEVFRNLISNAMKYNNNAEKNIILGSELKGNEVIFWVKDDGIGVAEDYQQKIFEVFKRLHGKNEYSGGSGIGLSIVQKVVLQHGGRLWLESELHKGAAFYMALPIVSLSA